MNTFGDILLTAVAGATLLAAPTSPGAPGAGGSAYPGGRPAGLAEVAGLPHQYAGLAERSGSVANSFRTVIVVGGEGYGLAKPIDIMTGSGFTPLPGRTDRISQLAF